MALEPQNIPISFSEGLDTKTDPKQVIPGKMLSLNNASFDSVKQIKKRDGNSELTSNILGGGSISKGVGVSGFKDELITLDGDNLYSYAPNLNANVNRGSLVPVDLSVSPVVKNINAQTQPDFAYHAVSGLKCFTWTDSSNGGVNYSIVDSETGTQIIYNSTVSSSSPSVAKVLTLGNYFVIFVSKNASSSKTLNYYTIDVSNPAVISGPTSLFSSSTINPVFDACLINGSIYICFTSSSTGITFYSLSSSLVLSSPYAKTTSGQALVIGIQGDASFNVWATYGTSTSLYGLIVNSALNATLLSATTIATAVVSNVTLLIDNVTASIFYEISNIAFNGSDRIGFNTLTYSGTAGTPSVVMRGVGLASKAFSYNGVKYFLVVYAGNYEYSSAFNLTLTTLQPTYFLINSSGKIIAKLASSLSGLYYTSGLIPEVVSLSSTSYSIPYLLRENVTSVNGNILSQTGVMQSIFNFQITTPVSKLVCGQNLLLGSGQLWSYDGQNIVEQGFHIYPENLLKTAAFSPGGAIGNSLNKGSIANQVQYVAVYEWVDNQGQVYRSATSPVLTVNLSEVAVIAKTFTANSTAGSTILTSVSSLTQVFVGQVLTDSTVGGNLISGTYIKAINVSSNQITLSSPAANTAVGNTYSTNDTIGLEITVPTLRQTLKGNVSITLYRTQNNQSIFYRVTSPTLVQSSNGLTYNDTSVDSVAITDILADSIIVGNEQLYTTGGEVPNIAAPAVSALVSFKNRAIYLSPENPYQFGYSKQAIPGVPVEFNSLEFVENVDQKIGRLTAIGTMDEKLILFGPSSKFFVVGDGPSPNGTNNDFTEAVKIAGTTGCDNQASVLETPYGTIYQDSLKGIWILDRSLQERYIGAPVREYNSYRVTSSQLFEDQNKAIFTLENGVNLVYDYYVDQWETDVYSFGATDSTIYEDKFVYIQADGKVLQQTPGQFSDNGSVIPLSFKTGWMSFAGIDGFQRVWELHLLGTYKSPHTLTINIYTDYGTTPVQTRTIPVLSDPGNYNYRMDMKVQKCEAIQVEIIESQSGSGGEGFSLSSLAFKVGVKRGLYNNLPAEKSY